MAEQKLSAERFANDYQGAVNRLLAKAARLNLPLLTSVATMYSFPLLNPATDKSKCVIGPGITV